jgi:hypothetical protein
MNFRITYHLFVKTNNNWRICYLFLKNNTVIKSTMLVHSRWCKGRRKENNKEQERDEQQMDRGNLFSFKDTVSTSQMLLC